MRKNIRCIAELGFTVSPASAIEPSIPGIADPALDAIVGEALANSPEYARARAAVAADEERVPQAGALPDPTLSLGIQNDGFKSIQIGKMETSFLQIMLSQPLPWPGKRGLREEVARLAAQGSESAVARLRLGT